MAHEMARMVKGIRLDILRALRREGPQTDYELEATLVRSHQSVSGGRRRCAIDGLVEDTGRRRENRFGNNTIVWAITPKGSASLRGNWCRVESASTAAGSSSPSGSAGSCGLTVLALGN
jgi:hypothetical protein